jgi:hypothetical protein
MPTPRTPADLAATFASLRAALSRYARHFVVKHDDPGRFYLDTLAVGPNKQPIGFACVAARKDKVTLYLMPAYVFPEVMAGASPAFQKARAGKSCFHFKAIDPATLKELDAILADSLGRYKTHGLLEATMYVPGPGAACEPVERTRAKSFAAKPAASKKVGKKTARKAAKTKAARRA